MRSEAQSELVVFGLPELDQFETVQFTISAKEWTVGWTLLLCSPASYSPRATRLNMLIRPLYRPINSVMRRRRASTWTHYAYAFRFHLHLICETRSVCRFQMRLRLYAITFSRRLTWEISPTLVTRHRRRRVLTDKLLLMLRTLILRVLIC